MFRDPEKAARWLVLTLVLILLKFIVYVYDSDPQAFFGDSGSYLTTALSKWIPPDRSFLYGFVVRALILNSHSLNSVVAFQTLAGVGTALLVARMLTRYFQLQFLPASLIAVALALEPQQLLFERFVLTESLSALIFATLILWGLEYLFRGRIRHLIFFQITGTLLVAFRVTFAPLILVASISLPFIRFLLGEKRAPARRAVLELSVSLIFFFGLHQMYKVWNGSLSRKPAAYLYADGFFMLASLSPLVEPSDTDNPVIADVLRQPLVHGNQLEKWNARNAELFDYDGLVPRIQKVINDNYRANAECRKIARRVLLRDPVGVMRLGWVTYRLFFTRDYMKQTMLFEAGTFALTADEIKFLGRFHLEATELATHNTVTRKYYMAMWPYFIFLIHTPLVILGAIIVAKREWRPFLLFLLLICTVHVVAIQALGVGPSVRHNHAVSILLAITVGALVQRLLLSRRASPQP
jgi:hypothetical protein